MIVFDSIHQLTIRQLEQIIINSGFLLNHSKACKRHRIKVHEKQTQLKF